MIDYVKVYKKRGYVILLMLWSVLPLLHSSQRFTFRNYQIENGLSHNTVNCGIQDSYGFIWFGTSNGLNCISGNEINIYGHSPSVPDLLPNCNILSIAEDAQRNLWIGTDQGCYIYYRNDGKFLLFDKHTKYGVTISCEVNKILITRDQQVWIGTQGQGIFIYNPHTEELTQDSRYVSFVHDLLESTSGDVYMSALQEGLFRFTPKESSFSACCLPISQKENFRIGNIFEVDGNIWVNIDENRLFRIDEKEDGMYPVCVSTNIPGMICGLLPYNGGCMLAGTNNGLYLFDRETNLFVGIDNPNNQYGLSDMNINGMLCDRENGIWIMTKSGGVNYMPHHSKPFDYYCPSKMNREQQENCRIVNFISEDSDKRIWFATQAGLYYLLPGQEEMQEYPLDKTGKIYEVTTLWNDGQELWVGTKGYGLKYINLCTGVTKSYYYRQDVPNSVCGNDILSIYRTSNGTLFVGTTNGLCQYRPQTDNFQTVTNIGYMISVVDMQEDDNQVFWIATASHGVFSYNLNSGLWKNYKHRQDTPGSLSCNNLYSITQGEKGELWLCTNGGGICQFMRDTETFTELILNNEVLSGRVVYAAEEDKAGHLWLSGDNGLLCIDKESHNIIGHYQEKDGLQSNRFRPGSSLKSSSGMLYFGGINGISAFWTEGFTDNPYIPPVYITGIEFQHADEQTARKILHSDVPLYLQKEIVLPYAYNSFSLRFAALSYQAPQKNTYSYQMQGIDKHATSGEGLTYAVYTNLPPGKYRFEIEGTNNDGKGNGLVTGIDIIVTPPWWSSPLAYGIYVLLALGVLIGIARRWNVYVRQKYKHKMEEFRSAQEREMYKSKINFFVNLVHEIRTPLTLIYLPLEDLMERNNNREEKELLSSVHSNVDYLLKITNELLDFQKIESGKITLVPESMELVKQVREVTELFSGTACKKGITLTLALPDKEVNWTGDKDKFNKIMVNLLGNALKFTHSEIIVQLDVIGQKVEIRVTDDGDGLSDVDKNRVFEPFYQANNIQVTSPGTGLGLSFARSLAQAHGGDITLHDASGKKGCTACLTLPLLSTIGQETSSHSLAPSVSLPAIVEGTGQSEGIASVGKQKKVTILLVEDNAELLKMVTDVLKTWYHVISARNGKEALEILADKGIDIVVSDVMMPEMDGLELCTYIKNELDYSHIPVVLLTAKTTLDAKAEGMEAGADAYIEKPFSAKQLHWQIENILRLRINYHQLMVKTVGLSNMTESKIFSEVLTQKDRDFIASINKAIEEQISEEEFSIDSIADKLYMSRSSFYRKLKALTSFAPNDYLKTVRLNRAAELLKGGMRITEVYRAVGFSSSSYFAKCFKNQFGVLPKEFVKGDTVKQDI